MNPLAKFWMAIAALFALAIGFIFVIAIDDGRGESSVFGGGYALLKGGLAVTIAVLAVYSSFLIRCPTCSKRITGVPDVRDKKTVWGAAPPKRTCRFCGYDLRKPSA
jgi:hypothetical protein